MLYLNDYEIIVGMRSDSGMKSTSREDNICGWKCPIYMNDKKKDYVLIIFGD